MSSPLNSRRSHEPRTPTAPLERQAWRGARSGACAFRVGLPHAPYMMPEVTVQNELGEDGLVQGWRMPVGKASGRCEGVHEARGKHQETEAQGVEQHLGERPDIDHAFIRSRLWRAASGRAK